MTQNMNRASGTELNAATSSGAGLLAGLSGQALGVGRIASATRRRGTLVAGIGAAAALTSGAIAGPEGQQVVVGDVTFRGINGMWLITASNGSIIDYVSFDILPFETVRFLQPDAMSTVLNRINSAAPTRIDGRLTANGQVYFINPAGVTFGGGAFVDCAGLYAAAANLSNEDFLAGRNNFTDARGEVVNLGTIQSNAVALVGRHVANFGTISTPSNGTIVMAAGKDVFIGEHGGHIFARINGDGAGMNGNGGLAGVENHGTLNAGSGRVMMAAGDMYGMAIFNSGTVKGREVTIDGGKNGIVQVSGKIDASSQTGAGGDIRIVGEKVGLVAADIDARGATGGGTVTIGRDLTSSDQSFGAVFVGNDTTIRADATVSGSGGDVRIYGRDVARVGGMISALGAGGGSGGSVTMAGSQMILAAGVEVGNGRWTIDIRPVGSLFGPRATDVTITTGADGALIGADPNFDVTSAAATVNINNTTLVNAINNSGTVTVTNVNSTGGNPGDMTLSADLTGITNAAGSLTFTSVGTFAISNNVQIDASAGSLNLVINAGTGINIGTGVSINLGATGNFNATTTAGNFLLDVGSTISSTGGNASLTAAAGSVTVDGSFSMLGGTFTSSSQSFTQGSVPGASGSTILAAGLGASSITTTVGSLSQSRGTMTIGGALTLQAATILNINGSVGVGGLLTGTSGTDTTISGGITADGVSLTATGEMNIDAAPGIDAGSSALSLTAGTNLNFGQGNVGAIALKGSTITLQATNNLTFDNVGVSFDGNTTLRAGDFSILSNLNGLNASTLLFRGVGAGPHTFRIGAASANIDILAADLANLSGFSLVTFGVGGDTINLGAASITMPLDTVFAGDVTLLNGVLLTAGSQKVTFAGSLGGAFALNVSTSGDTEFNVVNGLTSLTTGGGGTTILNADVTTSGFQLYNDAVTIKGAAVTLASSGNSNIQFQSTVRGATNGGEDLTVNTGGTTSFAGAVGGGGLALKSITTDAAGTTRIGSDVTTTGDQIYNDDVVITGAAVTLASSGSGAITFGKTLNGNTAGGEDLIVNTGGVTTFTGIVGGGNVLKSLTTDAAGSTVIGANVNTSGDQIYNDNVTISGAAVTLASTTNGAITFGGTLNGNTAGGEDLVVNTGGVTTFTGIVGGGNVLKSLTTDAAGSTVIGANVNTSGDQIYNDNVTISGAAVTLASTTNGAITFGGTLNGNTAGGEDLVVNTGGVTTFTGIVGGGNVLKSLTTDAAGSTVIGANVNTSGDQIYNDNVTISGAAVTLTSTTNGAITFGGTLNGNTAGGEDLIVNTGGVTTFTGIVGGGNVLKSLTTDAAGSTVIGANVNTSGDQIYNDNVTISGAAVTLASTTNGAITFGGTLNGNTAGGEDLVVNTGGVTTFTGIVGGGNALKSLTTDAGGTTVIGADMTIAGLLSLGDGVSFNGAGVKTLTAGDFTFGGTVTGVAGQSLVLKGSGVGANTFEISAAGGTGNVDILTASLAAIDGFDLVTIGVTGDTINLNDAGISAKDDLTFAGNTVLLAAVTLTSTNNDDFTFAGTLDGGFDLIIDTTGIATFSGVVGGNTALTSITTNAGGTTEIGANVTTTGVQNYGDNVVINGAAIALTSTGNAAITFGGTVDGKTADTDGLTVTTGGVTTFTGAVGATTRLKSLETDAAGSTRIGANVSTFDGQIYNDDVVITGAAVTLASGNNGAITFGKTIEGNTAGGEALTVNTGGVTTFTGAVGAGNALASLTTDAAGSSNIGANVTTTGAQIYNDDVVISGAAVTLASTGGGAMTFGKTVNGAAAGAQDLVVNTAGATTFLGAVGGTAALKSLTTDAGGTASLSSVATTGAQTYNDGTVTLNGTYTTSNAAFTITNAAALAGATTINPGSGNVNFNGTLNGAAALTVNSSGVTTFGGTSSINSLLSQGGGKTVFKASMTTATAMQLLEDVEIEGPVTLTTGSTIFFGGKVDSGAVAGNLTLASTGTPDLNVIPFLFTNDVGSTTALGSLTVAGITNPFGTGTIVFSKQAVLLDPTTGTYQINGDGAGNSFVVNATNGIDFGAGHRTVAFGNLTLNGGTSATFGDLTALGNITVNAASIQIRLRDGGPIKAQTGDVGSDQGVDLVALGAINFSTVASFIGSGLAPTYTSNGATNLAGLTFRQFDGTLTSALFAIGNGLFGAVDIKSDGPTATDVSTLLAGAMPRLSGEGALTEGTRISKAAQEQLSKIVPITIDKFGAAEYLKFVLGRSLYIDLPEKASGLEMQDYRITTDRLSGEYVEEVVNSYKTLLRVETTTDENGNSVDGPSKPDEVRAVLEDAWANYVKDLPEGDKPNGAEFRAYIDLKVEKANSLNDAQTIVRNIDEFFAKLDRLGLTGFETAATRKNAVYDAIRPEAMNVRQFMDMFERPAGAQPAQPQAAADEADVVALR